MRLSVESIARNTCADQELTVHGVEDAILRRKSEEKKIPPINHCENYNPQKEEINWMRNNAR